MPQIARRASLLLVSLLLALGPRLAQGEECKTGKRPLTLDEQTFYVRLTDVQAFMPEAPTGWRTVDVQIDGPDSLCQDADADFRSGKQTLVGHLAVTYERAQSAPAGTKGANEASRAQILVTLNGGPQSFPAITTQALSEVGASAAIRLVGKTEAVIGDSRVPVSGTSLVLIGPWKAALKEGRYEASPTVPANPLYTRLRNMVLEVRGDATTAADLLKAINIQALSRMIAEK
jgi:hypothetical protein